MSDDRMHRSRPDRAPAFQLLPRAAGIEPIAHVALQWQPSSMSTSTDAAMPCSSLAATNTAWSRPA
jgi:hypothetical protein